MDQSAAQDRLVGIKVGNYEVREKLGEGGMGSVYLAEHPLIGKKVALKVLHAEFSANEEVVGRFFNEARAVNDIQHPNIVDIIDYGVLPDEGGGQGMVYFIMEFLDGVPLNKLLFHEAPLPSDRALQIALQIADALAASHREQIVHRDLKPDNVILIQRPRERDVVKVLDFGIAKLTGDQKISHRTRTGMVLGTPAYMSPEQCEGKGQIDHRTDCYALGVLLYEMVTGTVPFQGEGYGEVLVQHITQPPAPPSTVVPSIDPNVEAILLRALEKKPDDRYASMDAFIQAMQDPAGYVAAQGGLPAFAGAAAPKAGPGTRTYALPPGQQPSQPGQQGATTPFPAQSYGTATPAPGHTPPPVQPTPPPGQAPTPVPVHHTPGPGQYTPGHGATPPPATPAPGTLAAPGAGRSRGFVIGGVAALVLGAAGGGIALFGGFFGGGDAAAPDAGMPDAEPPDAEPPDAGPPDAEPEAPMITVEIDSRPPGAAIFVEGEDGGPIGHTPHEFEVEQSDEEMEVRLEHAGRVTETRTFVPRRDLSREVFLPRVPTSSQTGRDDDDDDNGNGNGNVFIPDYPGDD